MTPHRRVRLAEAPPSPLAEDFARIREQFDVHPDFPDEVEEAAHAAAGRRAGADGRADLRELPFFTVDPPGSMDLDQAMLLERTPGGGHRVRYAIADVGWFVERGGPVEAEAWRRGVTVYTPDLRSPLYPRVLGEGAASLLPGEDRPAIVFTIDLDDHGRETTAAIGRALVRSHDRLDYAGLDSERAALLREIALRRIALAEARGAVALNAPAQRVVPDPATACGYRLEWEARVESEDWNAEISLLAGTVAAAAMLRHRVGLLRTMGGADPYRVEVLRRAAAGLGVGWPRTTTYEQFARDLRPTDPARAALLEQARGVMGRAGYVAFAGDVPEQHVHAGLATPYAHTTAPLRRLADRYVLDLLVDLESGRAPDAAAVETLRGLPEVMEEAEAHAGQVERAVVDELEARELEHRIGEQFEAVVVDDDARGARLQIADPPVRARLHGDRRVAPGTTLAVRLVAADPLGRSLRFAAA
ncbi:MAG TPA: RNB domain-containing ribonuclease [Gaiellales bacterium]